MLGQRIDTDRDRLTGLQARELRFLEIGIDVDAIERHQAGEALAGLDVIADLHGAIADDAVDRRADLGKGKIALGLGLRRLQFRKHAGGLRCCALTTSSVATAESTAACAL